jgi:hypothetical protein
METIKNNKVTKLVVKPLTEAGTPNRSEVVGKLLRDVLEKSNELDAVFVLYVNKNGTHSISYNFHDVDRLIGLLERAKSYLIVGEDKTVTTNPV